MDETREKSRAPYVPIFFYIQTPDQPPPRPVCYRSEGAAERDILSLGAMGWGLASTENSSVAAAAVAAVVAPWVGGWKNYSFLD